MGSSVKTRDSGAYLRVRPCLPTEGATDGIRCVPDESSHSGRRGRGGAETARKCVQLLDLLSGGRGWG